MTRPTPALLATLLILAAAPIPEAAAEPPTLSGTASVSSGGQILVRGNRIVLQGLPSDPAAPKTQQALTALIDGHTLTCTLVNKVGHGLWQGRCTLEDGRDVAEALKLSAN
jgi:nitrogen fixation protein